MAGVLVATALFRMTQNMALTTMSLLARDQLHLAPTGIGALSALAGLVLSVVTFTVARRVPAGRSAASAAGGTLLLVVSLAVFAGVPTLAGMAVAAVLVGAAGGLAMPGLINVVEAHAGDNRDRAIGIYTVTLTASLAVGPLLATFVLDTSHQDVRAPFVWFLPLPLVATALLVVPCWRSARSGPEAPAGAQVAGAGAAGAEVGSVVPPGFFGGLLGSRDGRAALIVQLLYAIPFAGVTSFGALVSRIGFDVTAAQAQLAFTAFFVASFATRGLVAWRSPIVRKQPLLWASAALTAGGLVLLGTGHGLGVLLVAMAVLGLPHGMTFPLALALVADSTDDDRTPRANAALIGSSNLSTVFVPSVLGVIIPVTGYQGMALLLDVPVALFAGLLFAQRGSPRHVGSR